jgi:hypothetical protein
LKVEKERKKKKMPKMARYADGNEYFVHTANCKISFCLMSNIYSKYISPSNNTSKRNKHSGIRFRNHVTIMITHMTCISMGYNNDRKYSLL